MPTVTPVFFRFRPQPAVGLFCAVLTLLASALPLRAAEQTSPTEATKPFAIPAGPAETTLKIFAEQSGRSVMFATDKVSGITTNALRGDLPIPDALDRLLAGTRLSAVPEKQTGGFAVRREATVELAEKNGPRAAATNSVRPENNPAGNEKPLELPTFEVMGSKLLNMDIKRSRDDAQPYVIFEREAIERSGATNLEDFLKQRLTMNTQATTFSQSATFQGNISQINLRGLGTGQTLILIDGRRATGAKILGSTLTQGDINGIPLAAVERIEVLPTTASGIYGGNATGGVVNIIMRRDYAGAEIKATYENTFSSDAGSWRLDFAAGLTLENGKTNVLLAANHTESNVLATADRNLVQRGRARILANNPASLLNAATPTLGATPNIRNITGANLTLKDGTPLNSPITFVPVGYRGTATDAGRALVANAGRHNFDLADSGQQPGGGRQALLNAPTVTSGSLTIRRQFSDRIQAFLDFSASDNESHFPFSNLFGSFTIAASAPNNPFVQAISVTPASDAVESRTYSISRERRGVGGVIFKLGHDWTAEADYTYGAVRTNFTQPVGLDSSASAAINNGTLDILRDLRAAPVDFSAYFAPDLRLDPPPRTTLDNATLRAAGPLGRLPGGAPTLGLLAERREDNYSESRRQAFGSTTLYPSTSQVVHNAYAEAKLPLVGAANSRRGVRLLELQLAARTDHYESNAATPAITSATATSQPDRTTRKFSSYDPTIGLRYQPIEALTLRASYGTGFVPPTVAQLVSNPLFNLGAGLPLDPRRGNTSTGPIQVRLGGNPLLRPEKSESWSAGAIFKPAFAPALRLSVDYTRIEKTDNITILGTQVILDNEALFPGRVTRGPVPVGDPFSVGPVTIIDQTSMNIARAEVEAYDVALDYRHENPLGTFDLYGVATWQPHYRTQLLPSVAIVENTGVTSTFPLKFKGNAGLTWKRGRWSAGWSTRYFDSYIVSTNAALQLSQGGPRVSSQIYHDANVSYRLPQPAGRWGTVLGRMEITVGGKNVFNREPPFDAGISASRYYSPYGDPRLSSYYVSVKSAF